MSLFLSSAEEAGAEVESHFIIDLDIKGCTGCFSCWWRTPGKCVHRDDMDWILPKMVEADAIVFGTPVYIYNINHHLQRLRERTLPLAQPDMEIREGGTQHPSRFNRQTPQRRVIIAVSGFPDQSNFNQIHGLFPDATKIFLPSSAILYSPEGRQLVLGFLDAVKKAGRELAVNVDISPETRGHLIVDFPPDVKHQLVEIHNERSNRITPQP
jgi:hypothetical protein